VGNTELMKRKRPVLVGVTQVKQCSHRDAIRVPSEGCVRAQKNTPIKSLEMVGVVRDNAQTGQVESSQKPDVR
jgi:hypothetical protein